MGKNTTRTSQKGGGRKNKTYKGRQTAWRRKQSIEAMKVFLALSFATAFLIFIGGRYVESIEVQAWPTATFSAIKAKAEVVADKGETNKPKMTVRDKIIAGARRAGINEKEALDVAWCESRFDPSAKNQTSSAKGVYMFINKTWTHYCTGNVLNEDDNIDCFMKLYKNHKSWWECSHTTGYNT